MLCTAAIYYGTPKKTVEDMLEGGKNVLLEIEPQGALKVKKLFEEAVTYVYRPARQESFKTADLRDQRP